MATAMLIEKNEAKAETEDNELKFAGTFLWNEVSQLRPTPTGILLAKPTEEMWGKNGTVVPKNDERNGRRFNIVYNKDFIADQLYRLYVGLGVYKDGELNEDLLNEIIEYSKEYSLKEDERQQQQEIVRMARPYVEERKWSMEQAIDFVKKQIDWEQEMIREIEAKNRKQ